MFYNSSKMASGGGAMPNVSDTVTLERADLEEAQCPTFQIPGH